MTGRTRRRWVITAGGAAVLSFAGWVLTHPRTRDPYPFLAGHSVADVGVLGPGSWPASELRTYSWKQRWQSVAAMARRELPAFGLKEQPSWKGSREGAVWTTEIFDGGLCGKSSEISVSIEPGRSRRLSQSEPLTDGDPEWATVLVSNYLEDNWVNIIRYTFFRIGE